ncbi:hypothetical protein D3C81_1923370 [compost metagenome]
MQMQDMPLDQVRQNTIVRVSEETVPASDPVEEPAEPDEQTQRALGELFLLKAVQAARTEAIQ